MSSNTEKFDCGDAWIMIIGWGLFILLCFALAGITFVKQVILR